MSSTGFLPSWICPENLQNKGSRRHLNVWMISTGTPHSLNLYLRLSVTNLHGKSHFGHLHSFPNSFSSLNNKILIFADKHSRLHQSIWLCSKSKNNQHYTWGWFWVLTLLLLFIHISDGRVLPKDISAHGNPSCGCLYSAWMSWLISEPTDPRGKALWLYPCSLYLSPVTERLSAILLILHTTQMMEKPAQPFVHNPIISSSTSVQT